jgi:catechol 2,3-dioxygenase-like lactoylglutathione lyase family enzyme
MATTGIHHTGITVSDLDRTIAFYEGVVGMRLIGRKHRRGPNLGTALRGDRATARCSAAPNCGEEPGEILIADMALGEARVEFIQYVDPPGGAYHGDPSFAGSAHIAIVTDDIEAEYRRLERAGVRFHTGVRTVDDPSGLVWKWCYFRDPDDICVELVQGG